MINSIIKGIMNLIIKLVNVILLPIDTLIESLLPDLSTALNSIYGFLQTAFYMIGWCIDAVGIPPECISIIVMYFTFKLTAPLLFYVIKLAIKWYNAIKL